MDRIEIEELGERVRRALDAGDVARFADLLDPGVRWGPPDDPEVGCHNRNEVIAWWKEARDSGMRAVVTEVVPGSNALLVGLRVSGPPAALEPGGEVERWQVLAVSDAKITDIRGFDSRSDAFARAGVVR